MIYKIGFIDLNKNYLGFDMYCLQQVFPYIEYEIVDDCFNNECDLIFYSTAVFPQYINDIKNYVSDNVKKINDKFPNTKFCLLHAEPHAYPQKDYNKINTDNYFLEIKQNNYSISHFIDSKTNCFCPYISGGLQNINEMTMNARKNKQNSIFCSLITSTESIHRRKYVELISKYKPINLYGDIYNKRLNDIEFNNVLNNSKFNLAIENSISIENEYYITEKITNAYYHGCIPIYFGSDYVYELFNEKTFIDVTKYSENDLLEYIKEIDTNEKLYNEIINTNILKDPNIDYYNYFLVKKSTFIQKILIGEI